MTPVNPPSNGYRVFVGAFPQGELARRIQAVREQYDLKTARITAPHVTLAGTYWRSGPPTLENESETIRHLQALRGKIRPFDLQLGGIHTFPPASQPVIYLGVEITSELLEVRRMLLDSLGPDKHRQFTPHLTLAMRLTGASVQGMLADLMGTPWAAERFFASIWELRLMQRGPRDPAWRPIFSLELNS